MTRGVIDRSDAALGQRVLTVADLDLDLASPVMSVAIRYYRPQGGSGPTAAPGAGQEKIVAPARRP
ncbi:MAG: hypothetical protein WKF75_00055 [Singulisphaera sp.]